MTRRLDAGTVSWAAGWAAEQAGELRRRQRAILDAARDLDDPCPQTFEELEREMRDAQTRCDVFRALQRRPIDVFLCEDETTEGRP